MGLVSGDADPTSEMNVWMSNGDTHLWHPNQTQPATPWEAEMDRLMQQQLVTLDYAKRKQMYDRVQEIVAEESARHMSGESGHSGGSQRSRRKLPSGDPGSLHALEY